MRQAATSHATPHAREIRSQRWGDLCAESCARDVACDFMTVTVRFRVLYVFVVLEVGTRRIVYWNVTEHPTAEWTIQQFRMVITPETSHRFVLHDPDRIYAERLHRYPKQEFTSVIDLLAGAFPRATRWFPRDPVGGHARRVRLSNQSALDMRGNIDAHRRSSSGQARWPCKRCCSTCSRATERRAYNRDRAKQRLAAGRGPWNGGCE